MTSLFNSTEDVFVFNATENEISPRELGFEFDDDDFENFNETNFLINGTYLENGTIGNDTIDGRRYIPSAIPNVRVPSRFN